MIIFNLKKKWYDKIKSGEKTHEYREVKPFWTMRLRKPYLFFKTMKQIGAKCDVECYFRCGYSKQDEIKASIKNITIINGKVSDLKIDKEVYDIEFEVENAG